jgi:cytochrome oxidase assembly protein ShyY1
MVSALELKTVAPYYVQQAPDAAPSGVYPAGGIPNLALRNPHL